MNADIIIAIRNGVAQLQPVNLPPALILLFLEAARDDLKARLFRPVADRVIEEVAPGQAPAVMAAADQQRKILAGG